MSSTARIQSVMKRYGDGRVDILTRGENRFEINEMVDHKPYLEAGVTFFDDKLEENTAACQELANNVVNAIRGQEVRIQKQAAGVIAPWHGIFLIGKDLNAAFDAVERFDTNARSILMAPALGIIDQFAARRKALAKAAAAHGKNLY